MNNLLSSMPLPPSGPITQTRRNNSGSLSLWGKVKGLFASYNLDSFVRVMASLHTHVKTNAFLYKTSPSFRRTEALNFLDQVHKTLIEKYKANRQGDVYSAAEIYCDALIQYYNILFPYNGTNANLYYIMILQKILEGKNAPLGERGASLLYKSRRARARKTRRLTRKRI